MRLENRVRLDRRWVAFVLALAVSAPAVAFQGKKKEQEERFRSVEGTVADAQENPVAGAVVQLRDTKTLKIRSFITQEKGTFYFHGLDPNVDYTLKAEHRESGSASAVRTLSSFDSRKKPVINLKLEPVK